MMIRLYRVLLGTTLFVMCNLLVLQASAAPPVVSVIYPTGTFPADANNIQAAVDKGGIVILKAFNAAHVPTAFNFSTDLDTSENVELTSDVTIIGERVGKYQTTINGGFATFFAVLPVKVSIQGIDFESPFAAAISILASSGADILGNVIHNVQGVEIQVPSGRTISDCDGIDFFGNAGVPITGKVRVIGNRIDGLGCTFSNGMQLDTVAADVEISGNTVTNVNSAATEQGGALTLIRLEKSALVSNNILVPGVSQISGVDGVFIDGNYDARYRVFGNWILCNGPYGDGIDIAGGDPTGTTGTINALVAGNHITVLNGPSAAPIAVFDLVTDALIEGNDLHGDGFFAMGVTTYGFETDIASLNRFIDNHLEDFTSNTADVYFDANAQYNLEIGRCKSAVDLGIGNSATCEQPVAATAVQDLATVATPDATHPAVAGPTTMQRKMQKLSSMRADLPQLRPTRRNSPAN